MAGGIFNAAKGRIIEKIEDAPDNLMVVLLKTAEAKSTLEDYATLADLLAAVGNEEADFLNYARKEGITGTVITDNTLDEVRADMPDQMFENAGGTEVGDNNTLAKILICYSEGATDADVIPFAHFDFAETTDGNTIPLIVNTLGFFRARESV